MKALLFIALLSTGCGASTYRPEAVHPSPERMQELLNAPNASVKPHALKFNLEVSRSVAMLGQVVTLTCYTPEALHATQIYLAVIDVETYGPMPVNGPQTMLAVSHLPCGIQTAICAVTTPRGMKRAETTIEVNGGMCE